MATAQAAAVALLVAARRGLPVAMHTPTEVKAAVTGNGRADKAQVTAMVTRVLRLDTIEAGRCGGRCRDCYLSCGGSRQQRLERARREMNPSVHQGLPHNKQRQRVDDRSGSGRGHARRGLPQRRSGCGYAGHHAATGRCRSNRGREVDLHTALVVREDSGHSSGSPTPSNVACSNRCKRSVELTADSPGLGERPRCRRSSASDRRRRSRRFDAGPRYREKCAAHRSGASRQIDPPSISRPAAPSDEGWRTAVAAGLTSLGWGAKEADAAVDGLAGHLDEVTDAQSPDIGVLLKEALRSLDRS